MDINSVLFYWIIIFLLDHSLSFNWIILDYVNGPLCITCILLDHFVLFYWIILHYFIVAAMQSCTLAGKFFKNQESVILSIHMPSSSKEKPKP